MAMDTGHMISPSPVPPWLNSPWNASLSVHIDTRLYDMRGEMSEPARLSTYSTSSWPSATSTGLLKPRPIWAYIPMVWLY